MYKYGGITRMFGSNEELRGFLIKKSEERKDAVSLQQISEKC